MIKKIISGGQTGSDQGGLDAAISLNIEHGGWCPKDRHSEDGQIPARYKLKETLSHSYPLRTHKNILESDGTIIFTHGSPEQGSALTIKLCKQAAKPMLWIDLAAQCDDLSFDVDLTRIILWIEENKITILNVAGNRESKAEGIQAEVCNIITQAVSIVQSRTLDL
jgi:hypothetical protein